MVMLGAPGSGKGTQAQRLAEEFDIVHEASGDLLRQAAEDGTELGILAKSYFEQGELVPDGVVCEIVINHIKTFNAQGQGVVLDGFPRTLNQAAKLEESLIELGWEIDAVIHIKTGADEIERRLASRGRLDDDLQVVSHRMDIYESQTLPLVEFYDRRALLLNIDGGKSIEGVHEDILAGLQVVAR
jgi:adenylate kinase